MMSGLLSVPGVSTISDLTAEGCSSEVWSNPRKHHISMALFGSHKCAVVQNFLVSAPASEISHHRRVVRAGGGKNNNTVSFRWSLRHRSLHSNKSSFRFRYGWALHTPGHENHPDTAAAAAHRKETDDTGLQSSRLRLPTHHPPA